MESASAMSFLSQAENRLGDPFRKGQREVAERFMTSTAVTTQLPTGLGKTRAAAAAYCVLQQRNIVNRVLYIVPRGGQARQAAEDFPGDVATILDDASIKSFVLGDTPIPAWKAHRSGECGIFITTIQALVAEGAALSTLRSMMGTGKWFIVVDEYHHYGDKDKPWTKKLQSLPHQALLAMSATPHRSDEAAPFGLPDPKIKYRDARELGYVKPLWLHAYDYRIDAMVNNKEVQTFTTSQIFDEAGSTNPEAIDRWTIVRELRWSPRYVSPLLSRPIARLLAYPFRAQMLVQAISCSHAKMVCEQIRGLVGPNIRVDWVGTGPRGRSDPENAQVLDEFCPQKDPKTKTRKWTLDILVNVGMAGEGLDSIDVCEVVFLNAPDLNNTTLQTIGRAARPPKGISPCPIAIISVDEACPMADYVGDAVETCFDEIPEKGKPREGNGDGDGGDYPLPPDVVIRNAELVDIRMHPQFAKIVARASEHPSADEFRDDIEKMVEEALREGLRRRDEPFNQSSSLLRMRNRIENGCRLKTFQVQGMLKKAGRIQVIEFQDIIKRIKTRKNREVGSYPEEALLPELSRHMQWLEQFEKTLKGGLPPWLL